jgi:hypothetical protein
MQPRPPQSPARHRAMAARIVPADAMEAPMSLMLMYYSRSEPLTRGHMHLSHAILP